MQSLSLFDIMYISQIWNLKKTAFASSLFVGREESIKALQDGSYPRDVDVCDTLVVANVLTHNRAAMSYIPLNVFRDTSLANVYAREASLALFPNLFFGGVLRLLSRQNL